MITPGSENPGVLITLCVGYISPIYSVGMVFDVFRLIYD
jgi:hypothetical protein